MKKKFDLSSLMRSKITWAVIAELLILLVGCVTAFVVSLIAIKTFIDYIKKNSFTAFGWYRIVLGALVAAINASPDISEVAKFSG